MRTLFIGIACIVLFPFVGPIGCVIACIVIGALFGIYSVAMKPAPIVVPHASVSEAEKRSENNEA